ncbi:PilW family protein [Marinobacter sp. SS21]|uniref:PilW family protein n=1 Tax=Marinobacter sp. SS21 TaxID=2979460 RepID=UPI00232DEB5C|nr:PilW family protein [Marinobacter sp. SS21]MDC0661187.1 PilW family protein [Marinobacter sp. SS21]
MATRSRFPSRQRGLSLVELMIAMALGLVMMAGLTQIFISNQRSFTLSQALAYVQESGREGAAILAREIRNADYWGCLSEATEVVSNLNGGSGSDLLDNLTMGVQVYPDTDATNQIVDGSHVIVLRGIDANNPIRVNRVPSGEAATLEVNDASSISQGDILMVSDCQNANIFQVTNNPSHNNSDQVVHNTGGTVTPGNEEQDMPKAYTDNASIFRPTVVRYSVQFDEDGRRALVMERLQLSNNGGTASALGDPIELVGDVRDLRTAIGLDTSDAGAVDSWAAPPAQDDANAANTLAQVLALRVSLLIRSQDQFAGDAPGDYCFPGWLTCADAATGLQTPTDRALYRSYTFTASIRNRIYRGEG